MRSVIPVASAVAVLTVGAGVAAGAGGGVTVPDPPSVSDVTCIATCAGAHKATVGSRVEASGRHLANVDTFLFRQQGGGRVEGQILSVGRRYVKAKVPDDAADGRPKLVDKFSNSDTSPRTLYIVPASQIPSDGGFKLQDANAKPRKSFFIGNHVAKVSYTFAGSEPTDVRVQVVHRSDGKIVDSFVQKAVEPNVPHTATWAGGARDPKGEYTFRIGSTSSGKTASTTSARFSYYKWKFPVRGHHTYGDGFGAPRAGHRHMGQDVMAKCGTPLVAARGGKVQYRAYQAGGAGYYVVIDGKRDDHDYAYMHLKRRAKVHVGERVRTGEKIGVVGDTGDATACHLHFEYWKNDWWNGGRALRTVTRALKKWDSWS